MNITKVSDLGDRGLRVTFGSGNEVLVPRDPGNLHYQEALVWAGQPGNIVDLPPDPVETPPTLEEEIEALSPFWKAAFEAYIEQQPRNKKAIINNIKRHLK